MNRVKIHLHAALLISRKSNNSAAMSSAGLALTPDCRSLSVWVRMMLKTAWERLLSSFMLVAATVRDLLPSDINDSMSFRKTYKLLIYTFYNFSLYTYRSVLMTFCKYIIYTLFSILIARGFFRLQAVILTLKQMCVSHHANG